MKKNNVIIFLILAILMLISFAIIIIYNKSNEESIKEPYKEEVKKENGQELTKDLETKNLIDHNRYFVLKELINDYIMDVNVSSLKVKDILFDEYDNNITNVFNDKKYIMSYVQYRILNERIITYNIKGYLEEKIMDQNGERDDFDVTIYLDIVNMTYQIALEKDYNQNIDEIKNNGTNQYTMTSVSNQTIATLYMADLKDKIKIEDPMLKDIITNYDSATDLKALYNYNISTFKINDFGDRMQLTIQDEDDNQYIFSIKGVLNYTVKIY